MVLLVYINMLVLSVPAHPNHDRIFLAPDGPGMFLQEILSEKKNIDNF